MSLIDNPKTEQYKLSALSKRDVDPCPAKQFDKWFEEAVAKGIKVPEAVNLATAELPSGRVSSRTVLLKELDTDGKFVIYSNWKTSRKARDVRTNSHVALTFFWKELERQVRVEGIAELMTTEESQVYFNSRPRGSRVGAWASQQSTPVSDRETLEMQVEDAAKRFEGQDIIPCPPFWGGIKITPYHYELWQGRDNRVHDRIVYDLKDGLWEIQRLSP